MTARLLVELRERPEHRLNGTQMGSGAVGGCQPRLYRIRPGDIPSPHRRHHRTDPATVVFDRLPLSSPLLEALVYVEKCPHQLETSPSILQLREEMMGEVTAALTEAQEMEAA